MTSLMMIRSAISKSRAVVGRRVFVASRPSIPPHHRSSSSNVRPSFPPSNILSSTRRFSTNPSQEDEDSETKEEASKFASFEDANPDRIKGIQVNPDSVGSTVLPGNYVYKKFRLSGNTRKVPVELEHGYFWMMWDLEKTGKKPTISNETLISDRDAESFPVLTGLNTLNKERVDLPFYFLDQGM